MRRRRSGGELDAPAGLFFVLVVFIHAGELFEACGEQSSGARRELFVFILGLLREAGEFSIAGLASIHQVLGGGLGAL